MEHTSLYFDVVIVGAGPAGSTCALALKNADLKVALLDKTSFPRDKICGDAIPTRVVKVLNRIDQKYVEALRKFELAVSVKSTRVVAPSGKSFTVHWKNEAFNCKRTDFDHLLFNWAKTETSTAIFENTPVLSVTNNNDCIHLHTPGNTFIAPIVIACDGAHSILAKKLNNFTVDKEKYSGAVRAYPNGVIGNTHHLNEIFFSKNLMPGYFWLFPVSESCSNVGLGMLSATIASKKIN
ncbi:MAG: FAD-dependent monooxygenase, partial [Sediminibacterium sp.]